MNQRENFQGIVSNAVTTLLQELIEHLSIRLKEDKDIDMSVDELVKLLELPALTTTTTTATKVAPKKGVKATPQKVARNTPNKGNTVTRRRHKDEGQEPGKCEWVMSSGINVNHFCERNVVDGSKYCRGCGKRAEKKAAKENAPPIGGLAPTADGEKATIEIPNDVLYTAIPYPNNPGLAILQKHRLVVIEDDQTVIGVADEKFNLRKLSDSDVELAKKMGLKYDLNVEFGTPDEEETPVVLEETPVVVEEVKEEETPVVVKEEETPVVVKEEPPQPRKARPVKRPVGRKAV